LNPGKKSEKAQVRIATVDGEAEGQRLDNFLLGLLKGVPRTHVYRLIRSGQVRVNSGRSAPSARLTAGDRVRVPPVETAPKAAPKAEPGGYEWLASRIVFEDARVLVLDKPAGLAVHGGSGVSLGAIEALRALRSDFARAELAHRLDRSTSGCLLVAKRRSALRMLHALFRKAAVEKRYFALVAGAWPEGTTVVEAPLAVRKQATGEARVRVEPGGKAARSEFRLLDRYAGVASFVEVVIATGRTHQIRVHAAHAGHPLAGDERYGNRDFDARLEPLGLRRLFLHAHSLALHWPDTGEELAVSVPLPAELKTVLDALEGNVRRRRAGRGRRP
jgi:23S rRNA pseudouridine955/2504/2580 synthase